MDTGCRTRWPRTIAFLALGAVLVGFPGRTPAGEPGLQAGEALERSQRALGTAVAAHRFTDSQGRRVSLAQFRGKPLIVSFVYTGCSQVCPTTTRFLARAVREADRVLGPDAFAVATIGFNLPYDTPEALRAFARQMDIDRPGWVFLSPDPGVPAALSRELGFSYAASAGGFDHLTQVTLLDAEGRVAAQVYGESFELPMLVGPLKSLATGAPVAQPSVAQWLEKARLLCTVYDPRTGRYRLDYGVVLEILVGLSIAYATLHFLLREWWRHRRRLRAG